MTLDRLACIDRTVFFLFLAILAVAVVLFGRANLLADSVDYYSNLQKLAMPADPPVVANLHFAAQRSPGFSIVALFPYLVLKHLVTPVTGTRLVYPPGLPQPSSTPAALSPVPPDSSHSRNSPAPPPPAGPGLPLIPPRPMPFWQVFGKDFALPGQSGHYRWTLALALAMTSYGFLFAGLLAIASTLHSRYPNLPGYALIVAVVLTSPIFLYNVFAAPLYATFTAFGASACFCRSFLLARLTGLAKHEWMAGAWLGLLVLTRLETAVFAAALGIFLLLRREGWFCARLVLGAVWALLAWMAYNWRTTGSLLSFEILRGDINNLRVVPGYIVKSLLHPACGMLFWSALVCMGLACLLASRVPGLPDLGIASLALVTLMLLRVPVMMQHIGEGRLIIGGLDVMPPPTNAAALGLIRGDMNRYIILLVPFAVVGLREFVHRRWPTRAPVM